ncbi:MAG: hypothetical protein IJS94_08475 [Clostridia bacterium]|nr:hypothetical protein [Clostridia bacterium]
MISFIRKNSRFMIFVFALFILGLSIARIFVIKANVQTLIFEQTQQYRVATNTATTAFLIISLAGIFVFALFSLFIYNRISQKISKVNGQVRCFDKIFTIK